ncbi:hypothetical protein [Deinococcus hopiensis]|uniref:Uncharacterized protein n=1 Tax=Deinococcus hopiensis KR-140 TaxID=695939 RepID=A0A1W1UXI9_9DEIO|nr:hypothetical protein [Deinococcus hopiensis]SMB85858.1 hypothetical protein SAMN00790413_03569 [Deinococcus hopiensis KR-140]
MHITQMRPQGDSNVSIHYPRGHKHQPALPHLAVITLTGWVEPAEGGLRVNGILVRAHKKIDTPVRVTVRAYPKTDMYGVIRDLYAPANNIRPAREPNGTSLTVTGQLLKVDRGTGTIKVKVCPQQASCNPFAVTLHATTQVLALDPGTFHVTVTGRLVDVGRGWLLAETVTPVYAPVPQRWHRWRPKRRLKFPKEAP